MIICTICWWLHMMYDDGSHSTYFRNGIAHKRVKVLTCFVFSFFGVYDMVDRLVCALRLLRNSIRKRTVQTPRVLDVDGGKWLIILLFSLEVFKYVFPKVTLKATFGSVSKVLFSISSVFWLRHNCVLINPIQDHILYTYNDV